MNDLTLIRKNLFQKGLRTTLLIVTIFIAFLIFGVLGGFNESFYRSSEYGGAATRLIANNKINFTQPLPIAYYSRIQGVEGVSDVTHSEWFGGYYQEPRNFLFTFAMEPESYLRIYKDQIVIPPDQAAAFIADRTGLLVGRSLAERFGWKVGDRVPLFSNIYQQRGGGNSWDFTLRAIYSGATENDPTNAVFLHWEYFNESRSFGRDSTGSFTVVTANPADNDAIADRIDALFANSAFETATQDEAAFNRSFLQQQGDITTVITLVVSAAFAAILMIVGNTMIMAVRERTKEIGVMKTLGFSGGRVMRMVLGESLLLTLIGAGLGLLAAAGVLALLSQAAADFIFGGLSLSPMMAGFGLLIALALGLITGLIPAIGALNLRIVDALSRK